MGYCFKGSVSSPCVSGSVRLNFTGDRDKIRRDTVLAALGFAVKLVRDGKI